MNSVLRASQAALVRLAARRPLQAALLAFAVALAASPPARAQGYPNKPLRLIVPFAAGGSTDVVARTMAQLLGDALAQQVVVENRPGAGGSVGAEAAAKAPADGYTLLLGTSGTLAINPALYPKAHYDPARDFAPVALLGSTSYLLLVHPGVAASRLQEFTTLVRARPGQYTFGSAGNGSTGHLIGELFKSQADVTLTHVPYRGQAPAMVDLIGGQIHALFEPVGTALPQVRSGKVKALAITGARRSALAPEIPTVAESGLPNFDATAWFAIVAPAGTPAEIVTRLNSEINKGLRSSELQAKLVAQQVELAAPTSPGQLGAFMRAEIGKWGKVVKDSGAKVD